MKDLRISIRLTEEEHYLFKLISLKKKKSMQKLLKEYILKEIKEDEKYENKKKN